MNFLLFLLPFRISDIVSAKMTRPGRSGCGENGSSNKRARRERNELAIFLGEAEHTKLKDSKEKMRNTIRKFDSDALIHQHHPFNFVIRAEQIMLLYHEVKQLKLEKIANWRRDEQILYKLRGAGLENLCQVQHANTCLIMVEAMLEYFDDITGVFNSNGNKLFFGLEDVYFFTGLLINGKAVIGKENDFRELSDEETLDRHVRAYVLFLIGCLIFPKNSNDDVLVLFLDLLVETNRISSYSWGATLLCFLHHGISDGISKSSNYWCELILINWRPYDKLRNAKFPVDARYQLQVPMRSTGHNQNLGRSSSTHEEQEARSCSSVEKQLQQQLQGPSSGSMEYDRYESSTTHEEQGAPLCSREEEQLHHQHYNSGTHEEQAAQPCYRVENQLQ
ncbi:protein MAIN-LIKE 1-like [Senna tora]|uniref:Protein MAIN-LIKE 1-like n=1 Tax=Senna tora TaxID=362788 RepID=A0A834SZ21_9FABA|nr:protein MAIN-LIKE 1-like [Senna tora]